MSLTIESLSNSTANMADGLNELKLDTNINFRERFKELGDAFMKKARQVFDAIRGENKRLARYVEHIKSFDATIHRVSTGAIDTLNAEITTLNAGKPSDRGLAPVYGALVNRVNAIQTNASGALNAAFTSNEWKQAEAMCGPVALLPGSDRALFGEDKLLQKAIGQYHLVKIAARNVIKAAVDAATDFTTSIESLNTVKRELDKVPELVKSNRLLVVKDYGEKAVRFKPSAALFRAATAWGKNQRSAHEKRLYADLENTVANGGDIRSDRAIYESNRHSARELLTQVAQMVAPFYANTPSNIVTKLEQAFVSSPDQQAAIKTHYLRQLRQHEYKIAELFKQKGDGTYSSAGKIELQLKKYKRELEGLQAYAETLIAAPKDAEKISELHDELLKLARKGDSYISGKALTIDTAAREKIADIWTSASGKVSMLIKEYAMHDATSGDPEFTHARTALCGVMQSLDMLLKVTAHNVKAYEPFPSQIKDELIKKAIDQFTEQVDVVLRFR